MPQPLDPTQIFTHVRIVMGTVVGLGITRLLMGLAGLVQHPSRARLSAIHLLWSASLLLELIHFWWWEVALFYVTQWNFGVFLFLIAYCIALFLLAALLFPDRLDEYDGYEDFFIKRRKWFFSIFAVTFVFDYIDTVVKGPEHMAKFGVEYAIQVPVGVALCLIAIWTPNRRYHLGLVLVHLVYQISWIARLFYTITG